MAIAILTLLVLLLGGAPLSGQGPGALAEANEAAGVLLVERLRARDGQGYERLRRCPVDHVLLVDGHYDHTDQVLRSLGVRFRTCSTSSFQRQDLSRVRLLIIDCPGRLGRHDIERVRRFVHEGGLLLSTDWTLDAVIEAAFPGRVRYTRRPTRDDVVRITTVDHDPLLRWMFPPGRPAAWWLENQSHPVEILSREVKVLLASAEMGRRYGEPALALTFRAGRGRVVHVVSHTYLQRNHCLHPWETRAAVEEAEGLGLPLDSPGYRRLLQDGVMGRVKAGDLNAALSAQQLLLNVVLASLEGGEEPAPPSPPPPPPETPPAPPPGGADHEVAEESFLHDAPQGERTLRLAVGLPLTVLARQDGWMKVRTPAGQTGWVQAGALRRTAPPR